MKKTLVVIALLLSTQAIAQVRAIKVSWEHVPEAKSGPAKGKIEYAVYFRKNNEKIKIVSRQKSNTVTYKSTDLNVFTGDNICFRVQASSNVDGYQESAIGKEKCVKVHAKIVKLSTPKILTVTVD